MNARRSFTNRILRTAFLCILSAHGAPGLAEVGDPQIRTDHPWYPGELGLSTFERLFATQAAVYERVTGNRVDSDESKALASWLWRNTHYWHAESGGRDLWGKGLNRGSDTRLREYWNGLFGFGFGLCGPTHSQWTAEFDHLLGRGRGRGVGAAAHNAFEVFLRDEAYGETGSWALLDHDLSTVIFDESGGRLLGLGELQSDIDRWIDRGYRRDKQHGWLVCGLHANDGESYREYAVAEYLAGYAGPPPVVHLRRGERMRRYFAPGLADGNTFVFWGRNYGTRGIPGPERSRTWVNQPEHMHGSINGTDHIDGQARFANVEYVYRPSFATPDYREGIVAEDAESVVFEFRTPYIIGATPPNDDAWGIYDAGCRNGLIEYSIDSGQHWNSLVRDWSIPRRGDEPRDFWSQSFCYGFGALEAEPGRPISIRFHNDGGKRYQRVERHLIEKAGTSDPMKVTYQWSDDAGVQRESHVFPTNGVWHLATGHRVRTDWVEFEPEQ